MLQYIYCNRKNAPKHFAAAQHCQLQCFALKLRAMFEKVMTSTQKPLFPPSTNAGIYMALRPLLCNSEIIHNQNSYADRNKEKNNYSDKNCKMARSLSLEQFTR